MKIYFARHGQYQNPDNVVPFKLPGFPLSENGIKQSRLIAERLKEVRLRDIFTSPIERCRETAKIISSIIHLYPNQKEELDEITTPLQGLTHKELEKLSVDYPYGASAHVEGGGETQEEVFNRVNEFVNKLKGMSKNSSHLLVSHGDTIQIYIAGILTGIIPHTRQEIDHGKIRYIPMGGLVMLDFGKSGIPKYSEII